MKNASAIIAIVKVKNIRNMTPKGVFQNRSNWQAYPAICNDTVVIVENTIATTNQLNQYTEWLTPTTESPYLSLKSFSLMISLSRIVKLSRGLSTKK